jgi:hypothetical protein
MICRTEFTVTRRPLARGPKAKLGLLPRPGNRGAR